MSRITDLAKAEADEAEAETPEEETTEPQEDEEAEQEEAAETAPVEEPPVTEAQLNALGAKADNEDTRHEKALRKILGEFWEGHETCPLCLARGFLIPAQPGEFDPGQRLAVEAAMGTTARPEYREHPTERRCEVCDGWGEMLNGSRKDGMDTSACQNCMGTGHAVKPFENVSPFPQVAYTPPPPPTVTNGAASPNADPWGRPVGHPEYYQDPALVGLAR